MSENIKKWNAIIGIVTKLVSFLKSNWILIATLFGSIGSCIIAFFEHLPVTYVIFFVIWISVGILLLLAEIQKLFKKYVKTKYSETSLAFTLKTKRETLVLEPLSRSNVSKYTYVDIENCVLLIIETEKSIDYQYTIEGNSINTKVEPLVATLFSYRHSIVIMLYDVDKDGGSYKIFLKKFA